MNVKESGSGMGFLPYYPAPDNPPDEREPGVLLLEGDGDCDCKTTADRKRDCWRIVDWELVDLDGKDHWFARSWYTIPDRFIAALVHAQGGAA